MKSVILNISLLTILLSEIGCTAIGRSESDPTTTHSLPPSPELSAVELERRFNKVPKFLRDSDLFNTTIVEPTQLFDNVYFVGYVGVGSFIVTTSDRIILIDAMWRPSDAKDVIIPGMKKLGLDPELIKYVVITHGHADHYGGARYIQDTYRAQVLMSQTDWQYITDPNAHNLVDPFGNYSSEIPKPSSYSPLGDGTNIRLGDTSISVLFTPGHTPGSISLLIPVKDNGVRHTVAIWGGTGLPDTLEENKTYLQSLNYFESKANAVNVDAEMSTHPFSNHLLEKMTSLRERKNKVPNSTLSSNPIVIGNEAFRAYVNASVRGPVISKISDLESDVKKGAVTRSK